MEDRVDIWCGLGVDGIAGDLDPLFVWGCVWNQGCVKKMNITND